jgi:predicted protein tyrosine phosphatase
MLYVCSLAEAPTHAAQLSVTHMVSMLGDDPFPETPAGVPERQHLKLNFHDIPNPEADRIAPATPHIEEFIDFGTAWDRSGPLLIHCYAGISRSMAAALTLMCLYNRGREQEAARLLRAQAPHASPNPRMIAIADFLLACDGRLMGAAAAIGSVPYQGPGGLVQLPIEIT